MGTHDLIVIGAGPSGSTCAALCAMSGKKVLLLEASCFPRDKVCGDCVNPSAWPVFQGLGIASKVRSLPSTEPRKIRFSVVGAGRTDISLPPSCKDSPEMIVRRRDLDALLAEHAIASGTVFQDGSPITGLRRVSDRWEVTTSSGDRHRAAIIVAADGRNSVTARLLGMHHALRRSGRVGIQTHIPYPEGYDGTLEMRIYKNGYGGLADLGNGVANLCLVANDGAIKGLREEVEQFYHLSSVYAWRSIAPISRSPASNVARDGVFLSGDAARVVEPFTGEGISFALRSGALLAGILNSGDTDSPKVLLGQEELYRKGHQKLYRKGLMVNHFTRLLSEHPRTAHALAPLLLRYPSLLAYLTRKVIS
jgi:menaquinone-9 beta-reductase